MTEWGIFDDDAADYTAEEAIEAGFYSREETEAAIAERYSEDSDYELFAHVCEEPDDDNGDEDDEDENIMNGPTKY